MALAPDESGILGGKSGTCTPKNYIFVVFKANSEGKMPCSFLQNGCSDRGCLNNICIASYGVGAKFFTTNLMSVDLLQNTPKTRKPIAERTSHKWHGYTTRGCSSLCCTKQLLLLPRNARNAQKLLAEKRLPRIARMNTDCYGALFSHRIQNTEFGSVGMAGMPYPPTSVNIRAIRGSLFSTRRFRVFRAFCGNIFSPTDATDRYR